MGVKIDKGRGYKMKALVTGASSGIGKDMARYLSQLGYDLVLVARTEQKLLDFQKELKTNVQILPMDVSKIENCKMIFEQAKDVDIVINNAGFGAFGEFTKTELETEIQMIETNIVAVHVLTKLFLKEMEKKNKGYILNVASIAGFMPGPLMATYYATKAYIVRLTEAIHIELEKRNSNISISVLCPGPVNTEFNRVANVKFAVKALSSEYVAKYAVDKMFQKKLVIIPSFKIKAVKQLTRFGSDKLAARIAHHVQKRKEKANG